jgi:L-lactate dehydrogenase complex protein LldG
MSAARDQIFSRVNAALAPLKERAALPDWDAELAIMRRLLDGRDPWIVFTERLAAVNGRAFTDATALARELLAAGWTHGYCDPALWPALAPAFAAVGGFTVETSFDRARVDDYQFGITRAAGAVAETGTLILTDGLTTSRLAALAPWVHVATIRRSEVFADLQAAVAAMPKDSNVIWATGPSKTADVEGILIEGVHGPGQQFALLVD